MSATLHIGDLPDNIELHGDIAVDSETMGLNTRRDRLCLVQLCDEKGQIHLVRFEKDQYNAPNLRRLLEDETRVKIFHYARFDIAAFFYYLETMVQPIFCTKIASRLARTYTDQHGLKDLCRELIGVKISKQEQSSDWGNSALTNEQLQYAGKDVEHLHQLRSTLTIMLQREDREYLAKACFKFLPIRVQLDLEGWTDTDIFQH